MTLESMAPALLIGALVVLISIVGVRFATRLGVPGLLLYLVLGLVLGAAFEPLHVRDVELGSVLGYAALILILAQGGLTTRVENLRAVMAPAISLASLGVLVSIAVVAAPLVWLLGLPVEDALLLGTVLAATDAAAVFSILRHLHLPQRLRSLLEGEAGFNDAPVVVLVTAIASGHLASEPWWRVALLIAAELIGGAAVGLAVGYVARWLLRRLALPAVGLYPIAAMALIVAAYGLADVLHASGFLAVYLTAVLIGSAKRLPHRRSIVGFADGLAWIAEIGLFVMLGLLADARDLPAAIPVALVAAGTIVLLARPAAACVSLLPFRWSIRDIAFVSVAGLRGAVPIVFAAIALGMGMPGARPVFDATLVVVLVLLIVQSPLLPRIARGLRLVEPGDSTELDVESAPLDAVGAVVLAVDVSADSKLVGVFTTELGLPAGAVVSVIVRGGVVLGIDENTRIRSGDRIVIVTTPEARRGTEEQLGLVARSGRLAGWIKR